MEDGRLIDWDLELKSKVRMQFKGNVTEISGDSKTALVISGKKVRLVSTDPQNQAKGQTIGDSVGILGCTPDFDLVVMKSQRPFDNDQESYSLRVWRRKPLDGHSAIEDFRVDFYPFAAFPSSNLHIPVLGRRVSMRDRTERSGVMYLGQENPNFLHDEVGLNPQDGFHPFDARFSRDYKRLTTIGDDQTARVWFVDAEGERPPLIVQAAYECSSVDLAPDARRLLVADDVYGSWRLWNIDATYREPKPTNVIRRITLPIELRAKSSVIVLDKGEKKSAYDLASGADIPPPDGAERIDFGESPESESLNADRTRKVVPSDRGIDVSLYDTSSGKILLAAIPTLNGFARFSPDGKRMLTVSDGPRGRAMQLWNTVAATPLGAPLETACFRAGFGAEGDSVWTVAGSKSALSIHDVETRRQIFGPLEIPGFEWAWVSEGVVNALVFRDDPSKERTAVRYRIPFKLQGSVPLMCDLAEAIASRKVGVEGRIELWPASKESFRELGRRAQSTQGNDPFLEWVRWLLLERDSELGKQLLE